jgi:hypothetical protein
VLPSGWGEQCDRRRQNDGVGKGIARRRQQPEEDRGLRQLLRCVGKRCMRRSEAGEVASWGKGGRKGGCPGSRRGSGGRNSQCPLGGQR